MGSVPWLFWRFLSFAFGLPSFWQRARASCPKSELRAAGSSLKPSVLNALHGIYRDPLLLTRGVCAELSVLRETTVFSCSTISKRAVWLTYQQSFLSLDSRRSLRSPCPLGGFRCVYFYVRSLV